MTYKPIHQENPIKVDNTLNSTYGTMGKKVTPTGWDSAEMQYRQAIKPVPVGLTPIKKMDDLR